MTEKTIENLLTLGPGPLLTNAEVRPYPAGEFSDAIKRGRQKPVMLVTYRWELAITSGLWIKP